MFFKCKKTALCRNPISPMFFVDAFFVDNVDKSVNNQLKLVSLLCISLWRIKNLSENQF